MSSAIKVFCLILTLWLVSCSSDKKSKAEELKEFVESRGFDYTRFSSILVITERGCPQCNSSFAKLMTRQEKNSDMLYVISAKGTLVDISDLFDFKNVLEDPENDFKRLALSNYSSCIFLTEQGEIDTLITIQAKGLDASLKYIESRL